MVVYMETMAKFVVALTVVLAILLHARTGQTIAVAFLLTGLLIAVIQFVVWDDPTDGLFTSHWMYMTLLLRAGTEALRGDGYPVNVHPMLASCAVLLLGIISAHEAIVTHFHNFHNYVHTVIYMVGLVIAFGAGSQRAAERCFGAAAALRVRTVRQFVDPSLYFALGLLLVGHQHDPSRLSIALHTHFGYFLMALACVSLACGLSHDVLPCSHPACAAMRRLHAFAWQLVRSATHSEPVNLPRLGRALRFGPLYALRQSAALARGRPRAAAPT